MHNTVNFTVPSPYFGEERSHYKILETPQGWHFGIERIWSYFLLAYDTKRYIKLVAQTLWAEVGQKVYRMVVWNRRTERRSGLKYLLTVVSDPRWLLG